jgi:hypothetical protein
MTTSIVKPHIVVLCGSTQFYETFNEKNVEFTLNGNIVLSIGDHTKGDHGTIYENHKVDLDELHKRKIDLADSVYVINKFGYIGNSTRSEIRYAISKDKPIEYMVDPWDSLERAKRTYNETCEDGFQVEFC